jgi:hypothetical protein
LSTLSSEATHEVIMRIERISKGKAFVANKWRMIMEKVVAIYSSFQEENAAEIKRRSLMSVEERFKEFAVIQERAWGKLWTETPIKKTVSFEQIKWSEK